MPEVYDNPKDVPREPQPKPKPVTATPTGTNLAPMEAKYDYAVTHARAQQLEVASDRTLKMFDYVDPVALKQVPFTLAHTATAQMSEAQTYAINDAVVWMNTIHGDETLGALVLSNLITDPVSRKRTQDVLFDMGGVNLPTPNYLAGGNAAVNSQSEEAQMALQSALQSSDPVAAIKDLDPSLAQAVQTLAMQFYDSITAAAAKGDPLSDQFGRVVATAYNGYTYVLDQKEQANLRSFVRRAQTGVGGTTSGELGSTAAEMGIDQIRRVGGGQLVLDKEWALEHPEDALAYKQFLEAQYPGAEVVLGKQGILGFVVDKFGMFIDYATAAVGAGAVQLGELYQQITAGTNEEVTAELAAAHAAEQAYSQGQVTPWLKKLMHSWGEDPSDPQAVQLAIDHVIDNNTFDLGMDSFWGDLKANTRPQITGFGFADNITRAQGLLPGDAAFNTTHTAIGIISQFAIDPSMWGPAVLGGLRDAGVAARVLGDVGGIPKIVDAAGVTHTLQVSNSAIHQATYARFARTAEEAVQTRAFIRGAESMADVAYTAGSEGELATLLHTSAGMGMEEARRMANIIYPHPGMTVAEARSASGIGMLDDALGTGAVDTVDRVYGIQAKLDVTHEVLDSSLTVTELGNGRQRVTGWHGAGDGAGLNREAVPLYLGNRQAAEERLRTLGGGQLNPVSIEGRFLRSDLTEQQVASSAGDSLREAVDTGGYDGFTFRSTENQVVGGESVWIKPQARANANVLNEVDALARKHTLESVLQGNDSVHPSTQGFIGGKQIRRLRRAAGLKTNAWDAAWEAVGHSIAEFPSNLFVRDSEAMRELARVNPGANPAQQVMFAKIGHLWRDPGFATAGEGFVLEDATAFSDATGVITARKALDKALKTGRESVIGKAQQQLDSALTEFVNTPNASMDRLHNIAREHGIPEARYRQMVEPYVAGDLVGDLAGQRQWFFDTYDAIIDESKTYNGLAKKGAKKLHETWLDDRVGGRLSIKGTEGDLTTEAVWTRKLPDQDPYPMPTIDADLERQIPLPTLAQYRSYATMTGRTMKAWEAGGTVRKFVSLAHGGLAKEWRTLTSWWRSWILGSRILFALPARIIGEQQLRMAAFGYDSMVWHPAEWFDSTRGLWWHDAFFKDNAHMWDAAGMPIHALGSMVDDMRGRLPMLDKAVARLGGTIEGETDAFFRSYSQYLTKFASSPSVKRWRMLDGEIASVDEVRAALNSEVIKPLRDTWRREVELTRELNDTRPFTEVMDHALERWELEMRQVVGDDPEGIIKRAIMDRKVTIDDVTYEVGTPQFAKKLQELQEAGRWDPGLRELPRRMGDYLPGDQQKLMQDFTRKLFAMFYSRPDLATSRVPLYRQIFKREYENFIKLGYDEGRAVDVARSVAAETTADLLFQLGAHTSGEYLLREIMPFFPAYRELGTTWVGRIPAKLGAMAESHAAAVGWVVGAGALVERANLVLKSAEALGIVHKEPDGTYYINVPFFGNVMSWLTFGKVEFNSHVPLSSIVGLLPVPFNFSATDDSGKPLGLRERLTGTLPSIGGPAVPALAGLKFLAPEFFGPVEDWVTTFGSDQSIGIPLIDTVIEGTFGGPSPFVLGRTRTVHEAMINSAKIDGMRLAIHENPMPELPEHPTVEQSKAYEKAWLAWRDKILRLGDDYQQHLYLLKAGIGAFMPFSVQITDEYKASMGSMWEMVNHMPGDISGEVGKAEMQLWLARNPGLEPWLVAKGQDHRQYDNPDDSLAAWVEGIKNGEIVVPDANTWLTYAMGTLSYGEHMARVADIRARAGDTWQEVLMNFDIKQELSDEQDSWKAWLDWNHNHMAQLGIPDVKSMLDVVQQYKALRAGKEEVLTLDQQRLIDFDQTMRHYAKYFDYNPDHAGAYAKLRGSAYDALFSSMGEPSDTTKGISKWFDKVADPYYTKLDVLYGSLKTAKDEDQESIYADIRKLSDTYDARARKSGDPTPESYVFAKKTPAEQHQTVAKWAALPGTWLTAFQRRQVGYEGDDTNVTKYSNYVAFTSRQLHLAMKQYGIGPGTTAEDDLKAQVDVLLADKAKELGVEDTVHEMNAPAYVRIGHALNLTKQQGWQKLVQWRNDAEAKLAAARGGDGLSLAGSTVEAEYERDKFFKHAESLRQADPELDRILNQIAAGLDESTNSGLYDNLFFDITF